MSSWQDRFKDLRETIEQRTGIAIERAERVKYLEESDAERRMLQRDLDLLAYTALDYVGNRPQELRAVERRRLAQRSRIVWMKDPQAGAAVDLMNDFVFGRGMSKPKANDPQVQAVIDEAWEDPDNQIVLTSYQAQLALGTDLELQSNLFVLIFEDGEDGKVKLGLLDHDSVENVVRDEDNRLRIMYYIAREFVVRWDFANDRPQVVVGYRTDTGQPNSIANAPTQLNAPGTPSPLVAGNGIVKYYPHWRNVEDAVTDAQQGAREMPNLCPPQKLGDGKVYHVAINRGSEMAFGHPRMDRLIRWFNAYNNFMDARVDIMAASAAFVMKRKVKGTPAQLQRAANQALSRRSILGMSMEPIVDAQFGPKAGGILTENDSVSHEDFNINTNAPAAAQDAQMLRSQISAATRWPASYYGDASQSNLATATSLELPVLKAVEARQEVFESMVRFFIDRVIERAVDTGRISKSLTPVEQKKRKAKSAPNRQPQPDNLEPGDTNLSAAYEDESKDEAQTERDLGYEFSMPNPLKRMIGDLVLAIMNIAKTFDPNNTNTELSRTLLAIALGEGLEMEDPAGAVERIFPQGYVDPAVAAAEGPPGGGAGGGGPEPGMNGSQYGEFSPDAMTGSMGDDSNNGYGGGYGGGNPYGAASGSQSPEQAMEAAAQRAALRGLREMRLTDLDVDTQQRAAARADEIDELLDRELNSILAGVNGNGNGAH